MERTIRVTGRGRLSVRPDTVRINITADGVFREYSDAIRHSAEDTEMIRKAIEKAGLDPKELKTVSFNVDTEYEGYEDRYHNWKQRFKGYKYVHLLNISFPIDNTVLGKVLYELSRCSVSVRFNITYTVKDTEEAKNELLKKAVTDSREKALILTGSAGVSLGDIATIDYSWSEVEICTRNVFLGAPKLEIPTADGAFDLNFEADDIDLNDTVTVVWNIN